MQKTSVGEGFAKRVCVPKFKRGTGRKEKEKKNSWKKKRKVVKRKKKSSKEVENEL